MATGWSPENVRRVDFEAVCAADPVEMLKMCICRSWMKLAAGYELISSLGWADYNQAEYAERHKTDRDRVKHSIKKCQ